MVAVQESTSAQRVRLLLSVVVAAAEAVGEVEVVEEAPSKEVGEKASETYQEVWAAAMVMAAAVVATVVAARTVAMVVLAVAVDRILRMRSSWGCHTQRAFQFA